MHAESFGLSGKGFQVFQVQDQTYHRTSYFCHIMDLQFAPHYVRDRVGGKQQKFNKITKKMIGAVKIYCNPGLVKPLESNKDYFVG